MKIFIFNLWPLSEFLFDIWASYKNGLSNVGRSHDERKALSKEEWNISFRTKCQHMKKSNATECCFSSCERKPQVDEPKEWVLIGRVPSCSWLTLSSAINLRYKVKHFVDIDAFKCTVASLLLFTYDFHTITKHSLSLPPQQPTQ